MLSNKDINENWTLMLLNKELKQYPKNPAYRLSRAKCYMEQKEYSKALEDYDYIHKSCPMNSAAIRGINICNSLLSINTENTLPLPPVKTQNEGFMKTKGFTGIINYFPTIAYTSYQTTKQVLTTIVNYPEKILLGDMRKAKKALSDNPESNLYYLGKIGKLFGNEYLFFVPPNLDEKEIKEIITNCDSQNNGRKPYQGFSSLAGGGQHFFAQSSNKIHLNQMKDMMPYLRNPSRYAQYCSALLEELKLANHNDIVEKHTRNIVRTTMLQVFFGAVDSNPLSNQLPPDLNQAINSYSKNAFEISKSLFGGWDWVFSTQYHSAKKDYKNFANRFLLSQLKNIMDKISNFSEKQGQNILADVIVRLFKEKNPNCSITEITEATVIEFFKHPYVMTLPSIFFGGDNTIQVINTAINLINDSYFCRQQLSVELGEAKKDVTIDINNVLSDKSSFRVVDGIYHYALAKIADISIVRSTDHAITTNKISIPANSKIIFYNEYAPFSFGKRSCPGSRLAEAMVKAIIIQYALNKIELAMSNLNKLRSSI